MGKKLREEGKLSEEEIKEKLRQERQRMHEELKNEDAINFKNSHEAALAKQKHMEKLKKAMKIGDDFESGAAFDQELQDQRRLERIAEKDRKRKQEKQERKQKKKEE